MNIHVYRFLALPDRTLGFLMVDSAFMGYTLEDTHRPAGVKVQDKTAIPAGSYAVSMHYWEKFNVWKPMLEKVPGFEGVLIHGGNGPQDTDACILVGRILGPDSSISASITDVITQKVQAAIAAKQPVTCHIVNSPDLKVYA